MPVRNVKNIAIFFALVVGTGFVYHVLTNVTKQDMIAFLDLDREVNLDVMEPGDIVAISPDGQRHERICVAQAEARADAAQSINKAYYNSLGQVLPSFASLMGTSEAKSEERVDPSEVRLHGEYRGLRVVGTHGELYEEGCGCEIARRMLLRNTVCQVKASLIEYSTSGAGERIARTVAVQYPTYANVVGKSVFEACGLTYNPTIEAKAQICGGSDHAWDVRLRRAMNLIEERPLQPMAFGPPEGPAASPATVDTAALAR